MTPYEFDFFMTLFSPIMLIVFVLACKHICNDYYFDKLLVKMGKMTEEEFYKKHYFEIEIAPML